MGAIRKKKQVKDFFRDHLEEHPPRCELSFLMVDWSDGYNVGGLFRVADACGVTEMFASGKTPLEDGKVGVTSLGAHRRIPVRYQKHHADAAQMAIDAGYTLVAVEVAESASDIYDFDWPAKVCLALGNEQAGLYQSVIQLAAASVFVPMAGKGRSMNVHVTAAVAGCQARFGR